ncbi:hypothetical protein E2562_030286 [Oryza meyeriana var. granulata]|uniref:Uncharacterized protein n=1 Tax=Oryza meyeriana var. granulata TaxID=110450 RepID=A0A6G1EZR7_9ORYZ|nr:hypothetical protein E2562_030286 [Oryza meyeriana var. granulata]
MSTPATTPGTSGSQVATAQGAAAASQEAGTRARVLASRAATPTSNSDAPPSDADPQDGKVKIEKYTFDQDIARKELALMIIGINPVLLAR